MLFLLLWKIAKTKDNQKMRSFNTWLQFTGNLKSGGGGMNGGGIPRPQRGSKGASNGGRYPHISAGGGIGGRPYVSPSSCLETKQQ